MSSRRFIIGTVNQGRPEIGKDFSAYKQNTIFLSGVCKADTFLDGPAYSSEERAYLKNIGFLTLKLTQIFNLSEELRIAELEMDSDSRARHQTAVNILFRTNSLGYIHQEPPIMTLSPGTVLKSNDLISVGYLSVLEPKGDGIYNLKHDYQLERTQGPRYEKFVETY